jgi:hypothetical protein
MMTLKDFIKGALTDIVLATKEFDAEQLAVEGGQAKKPLITATPVFSAAQASNLKDAGLIQLGWNKYGNFAADNVPQYAVLVDFDVAVSAEETSAEKGGGKISVVSIISAKAEAAIEAKNTNSSVSRVRFKLPIRLA